jgi:hypothetical protein
MVMNIFGNNRRHSLESFIVPKSGAGARERASTVDSLATSRQFQLPNLDDANLSDENITPHLKSYARLIRSKDGNNYLNDIRNKIQLTHDAMQFKSCLEVVIVAFAMNKKVCEDGIKNLLLQELPDIVFTNSEIRMIISLCCMEKNPGTYGYFEKKLTILLNDLAKTLGHQEIHGSRSDLETVYNRANQNTNTHIAGLFALIDGSGVARLPEPEHLATEAEYPQQVTPETQPANPIVITPEITATVSSPDNQTDQPKLSSEFGEITEKEVRQIILQQQTPRREELPINPPLNFINHDLKGRDMQNTNLIEADLRKADCSGTNFTGSNLSRAICWNTIFDESTILKDVDIAYAKFEGSIGLEKIPSENFTLVLRIKNDDGEPDCITGTLVGIRSIESVQVRINLIDQVRNYLEHFLTNTEDEESEQIVGKYFAIINKINLEFSQEWQQIATPVFDRIAMNDFL